jgi:hypothetical protein
MIAALKYHILKPQNLHDSETQSAIDPTNPLVYIEARNLALRVIQQSVHYRAIFYAALNFFSKIIDYYRDSRNMVL